ncbi:hypothetical protein [Caldisericum sp.]|uniref:hypothetical protein n=1 Tax=Caldisericum sp. TaxID=2499687 RepID=UPI003D1280F5
MFVLVLANSGSFKVKANDEYSQSYVDAYNLKHTQELLNEALDKAILLNKNNLSTRPKFSIDDVVAYSYTFYHYDFGSGFVNNKGYWIKSISANNPLPYPSPLTLTVNEIQALSGSVSVNAEITASLKNVPAYQEWTITAWYPSVSSSGTAYYKWIDTNGNTGITAKPCGAVTPRVASSGFSLIYFDAHQGSTQP